MNDSRAQTTNRRAFLASACALAATTASNAEATTAKRSAVSSSAPRPHPVPDDEITTRTIAEAEKLAAVEYSKSEREQLLQSIDGQIERLQQRREIFFPNQLGPAQIFDPRLPGMTFDHLREKCLQSEADPGPLPKSDEDIAFAPVTALSSWIKRREISSERLTEIYLHRLKTHSSDLECVITLTEDHALEQARRADRELASGRDRGPLHGIPWGAKDLFDTAGIATTWGATPWRDRVPETDAVVIRRLRDAGAVLVAKLTLGALAYNDIWFGGKTRNPWNPEEGSSGSSAGSCAAVAAGLVGFALGTETYGSIVSPCMRCGTTGLRPTFGRVARTGAMSLCWSLDKIGPIARTVEDTALVLSAINGADLGDPSSVDMPLDFDAKRRIEKLRIGYVPAWFESDAAGTLDRNALQQLRQLGVKLIPVELPDWPYDSLLSILMAEAASSFEVMTLENLDDQLVWQDDQAWPNSFRQSRFVPAVEYVQAERFRREVCEMMSETFNTLDAMISPSFAGSLLLITNNTGHPSLTLRCGFTDDGSPHGITLWGRLFEEGSLCSIGMALEKRLSVWDRRPELVEF